MNIVKGKWYLVNDRSLFGGQQVGKCIFISDRSDRSSYLIEFEKPFYGGHEGDVVSKGKVHGKESSCWWLGHKNIIKELSDDEMMVYNI